MHDVSLPVSGAKFSCRKHNFVENLVGGCTSYDVIAPLPDLIWPFFCQKLCNGGPIKYAKFRRDLSSGLLAISEKKNAGASPAPAQARVNIVTISFSSWNLCEVGLLSFTFT